MKSVIITLVIGISMIGGSLFYTSHLKEQSRMLTDTTRKIEASLHSDDFDAASITIEKLDKEVERFERFFLATGDHLEMDNIKINISELKSFSEHEMKSDALAKVYVLRFLFEHLPKNSELRIGNIL